jgi:hypothetical protein
LLVCDGNGRRIKPGAAKRQEPAAQNDGRLLRAAKWWAEKIGFPVFSVEPRGKAPLGYLVRQGFKDATLDLEKIGGWWRQEPNANIGVAIPDGFFVVDLDGSKAISAWENLCGRHGESPRTITVETGRGQAPLLPIKH